MCRKLKGSYTVEASLLFPFILTVLVLIIYLSFFIHDRQLMQAAAYTSALRGSQIIDNRQDVFTKVEESSKEILENRLLAVRNQTTDIQITGQKISVTIEGAVMIPVGTRLIKAMGKDNIPIKVTSTAKRIDDVKFIRE